MTEQEWLAATDPTRMLEFLRGTVSDRKLRLFACSRARSLWRLLIDDRSRDAVDVAEDLPDGSASEDERSEAYVASFTAANAEMFNDPEQEPIYLAAMSAAYANNAAWDEAYVAAHANSPSILLGDAGISDTLPLLQIRDIFGNPFHQYTSDPSWLTSDVVALSKGIYEDRAFGRMPILADALQDADCDNADILDHCRGSGPHARGCWVVDMLLGKS